MGSYDGDEVCFLLGGDLYDEHLRSVRCYRNRTVVNLSFEGSGSRKGLLSGRRRSRPSTVTGGPVSRDHDKRAAYQTIGRPVSASDSH
jgi:hypothetical protein